MGINTKLTLVETFNPGDTKPTTEGPVGATTTPFKTMKKTQEPTSLTTTMDAPTPYADDAGMKSTHPQQPDVAGLLAVDASRAIDQDADQDEAMAISTSGTLSDDDDIDAYLDEIDPASISETLTDGIDDDDEDDDDDDDDDGSDWDRIVFGNGVVADAETRQRDDEVIRAFAERVDSMDSFESVLDAMNAARHDRQPGCQSDDEVIRAFAERVDSMDSFESVLDAMNAARHDRQPGCQSDDGVSSFVVRRERRRDGESVATFYCFEPVETASKAD